MKKLDQHWRLVATGISFVVFGLGGIIITFLILPFIRIFSTSRRKAWLRCQYVIYLAFRVQVAIMYGLRVFDYKFENLDRLKKYTPALIIANHPTLIDVVFIISRLPQTFCIVKRAVWSNPFMAAVVWMAGYIPGDDSLEMLELCQELITEKDNLVVFPEGTRTVPGQPLKLKRGAASIIFKMPQKRVVPIVITCSESMLTKQHKWYNVPENRPFFKVRVDKPTDLGFNKIEGEPSHKANRRLNQRIVELLVTEEKWKS